MMELHAALKHAPYEAIRKGLKKTEYRDMTEYWIGRLLDVSKYNGLTTDQIKEGLLDGSLPIFQKPYTHIVFHENGRFMKVEMGKVKTERNMPVFAIKLGDVQEQTTYK